MICCCLACPSNSISLNSSRCRIWSEKLRFMWRITGSNVMYSSNLHLTGYDMNQAFVNMLVGIYLCICWMFCCWCIVEIQHYVTNSIQHRFHPCRMQQQAEPSSSIQSPSPSQYRWWWKFIPSSLPRASSLENNPPSIRPKWGQVRVKVREGGKAYSKPIRLNSILILVSLIIGYLIVLSDEQAILLSLSAPQ